MSERHGRVIPIFALATAGCLWGTGFYFGKIALREMPVSTMVLFRLLFACAGLLPFLFFDRPRFARAEWVWVLAVAAGRFAGEQLHSESHGIISRMRSIKTVLFTGEQLHSGGWFAVLAST